MSGSQPAVQLFDAREHGLDAVGLRDLVHQVCARCYAAQTARSYRYPLALAAWHELRVGVDLERIEKYDARFAESIQTPRELAAQNGLVQSANDVSELWCSKEALAKALGDANAYDPRRLDSPLSWPAGICGPWRATRLTVGEGYVGWLVWLTAS